MAKFNAHQIVPLYMVCVAVL